MSGQSSRAVELFGIHTFNTNAMRQKLPRKAFKEVQDILHRKTNKKLTKELASQIAHGMKAWAIENGATHFSHWFQPLTGSTAEKHDGFLELDSGSVGERQAIDHFSYAELLQSEPDASSFPHGGMRTTFEARGYTAWDPTSPAFLLVEGSSRTLCIPSLFVSYHGMVLDKKTPLLRSLEVLDRSTKALLKLLGKEVDEPIQTYLGLEQEFFLVDRKLGLKRKDLVIGGRTMFGAPAPKEQQLGDHYFGRMPPQVLEFMETLQEEAYKLGIPIKTRHNEAAPRQYEVAPIFESSNLAIDHNLLLMSIMKRAAKQNDMMLLLHEKPFSGVNGSGKHNNWSLGTPSLGNFLEPGETPESNLQFLLFLICVIRAVYNRADLLRMSIACHGNDFRLGGHEAPPAIMSVFLGDELHAILEAIKGDESLSANSQQFLSLGVSKLDAIQRHNTDRNRTSPFAFTGNKFEFRAVPSSISCAFPNTVLNLAMAEAIDQITLDLDSEIKAAGGDRDKALFKIFRTEIIRTERIRFEGDGYSHEWVEEAERRGLKNIANTFDALASLSDNSDLFVKYGVLSDGEVQAFYNICAEQFIVGAEIEARTLIQMLEVDLIPAVLQHQKSLCDNLVSLTTFFKSLGLEAGEEQDFVTQRKAALDYVHQASSLIRETQTLKGLLEKEESLANLPDRGSFCVRSVQTQMLVIRGLLDTLEQITPSSLWPFPTYTDLLDPGTA